MTAIDTYTELKTLGSDATPGTITVPPKATKLLGCLIAWAADMVAAAGVSGSNIKLTGAGLLGGSETIALGVQGVPVATGGVISVPAKFYKLDVSVQVNQPMQIFAQMVNEDLGQTHYVVSLIFEVSE